MKKPRTKKAKKISDIDDIDIFWNLVGRVNKLEDQVRVLDKGTMNPEFKAPAKKIGRWKPEMGELYYSIESCGGAGEYNWENDEGDRFAWNIGNCYETYLDADKAKERMLLIQEYRDFCKELNNWEEIDWKSSPAKYCIAWDYLELEFICNMVHNVRDEGVTYCLDEHLLDKALEKFGEEKLKIILGV